MLGIDSLGAQQCLVALLDGIEAEAVGQRLATLEGGRVQIDAPLGVAAGSLCQFVGIIQRGILVFPLCIGV